jgi:hypothetical protein
MANQSKVMLSDHLEAICMNVMLGLSKNKAVTGSIIVIIGFLLYIHNSRSSTENPKIA